MEWLAFVLGALAAVLAQVAKHFLDIKREERQWARETPEREAVRVHEADLERSRRVSEIRRERIKPLLDLVDQMSTDAQLVEMTARIPEGPAREAVVQMEKRLEGYAMAQAGKAFESLPLITDDSIRRRVLGGIAIAIVGEENRAVALDAHGYRDLRHAMSDLNKALEEYVTAL